MIIININLFISGKKKSVVSLEHFLDMDEKKVQEIGASSTSTLHQKSATSSTTTPNQTQLNVYQSLGKEFPYTTFDQRLIFLLQYLRFNPLGADEEMFLQKHGLKDVEMVAFPPLRDFVSGDKADYSDTDEDKCKVLFL